MNPECADQCLVTLLEYIEDCQFAQVHLNVNHIYGRSCRLWRTMFLNSTSTLISSLVIICRFIRYIFNRINLESSEIRTACISTLGKFALHHSNLKSQIISILKQVLNDPDEETSERAYYYICILENQLKFNLLYFIIDSSKRRSKRMR